MEAFGSLHGIRFTQNVQTGRKNKFSLWQKEDLYIPISSEIIRNRALLRGPCFL